MNDNIVVRRSRKPISPIPKRKDPNRPRLGINLGEKNGMWKGDNVGYLSLHEGVRNHLPRVNLRQRCNKVPPYDLANISGEYKRDLNDWQWLCRRCHILSDGRLHSRDSKTGKFVSQDQPFTPFIISSK